MFSIITASKLTQTLLLTFLNFSNYICSLSSSFLHIFTDRVFNQALSRAPDNSKILHLYATFLHKSSKRQHQTSARMWQRAVLLAPRDADILTGYGTLLHRVMCKPMDAKPLIMRALAVDPKHPFALLANALLLQANSDYEES